MVGAQDIQLSGTTRVEDVLNSLPSVGASQASGVSNGGGLGVLIGLTQPTPEALAAEFNAAAAELMEHIVSQAREVFEQRQAIFGAAADRERHA